MDQARLKWLMRRGMKELDIMVSRYYAQRYALAPERERAAFEHLLSDAEDPDIWAWAMGYSEVPEAYHDVVRELRIYR